MPCGPAGLDDLQVELACIKKGGRWKNPKGESCGEGLFSHFMNARKLAWPDRYRHRWTDLIFQNYIDNIVTILMGPAFQPETTTASGAVECALLDWWSQPQDTLLFLSPPPLWINWISCAVLAELEMLCKKGQDRFPWLSGVPDLRSTLRVSAP